MVVLGRDCKLAEQLNFGVFVAVRVVVDVLGLWVVWVSQVRVVGAEPVRAEATFAVVVVVVQILLVSLVQRAAMEATVLQQAFRVRL